jgi:formamidopyrimidine-DNA glycosylase
MPELPEVETVVRQLRPELVGRAIRRVVHVSALMAKSELGPFESLLPRRQIERLERHGKWMFLRLSDGNTLVVHLGMTGRLGIVGARTRPLPHTHLRLALDDGARELRFSDPRRFGELLLVGPATFAEQFGLGRLGPDATRITRRQLAEIFAGTRRCLKAVLLDQRSLAGIGNIYADEILFEAGLYPGRLGRDLASSDIERVHRAMGRVLRRAIRHNGTSIRDYVTGNGVPGEFQNYLNVYGRADQPCKKCSTAIELIRTVVRGRATFWCPACQAGP